MIRTADVYKAVKALWDVSALPALVPGGLWEGRPRQAADDPYAVAKVEEGDKIWTSGVPYVHHYNVTLSIWSAAGVVDAAPFQSILWGLLNRDSLTNLTVAGATKTVDILPLPAKVEKDVATLDSKDVLLTALAWEIVLQGTR